MFWVVDNFLMKKHRTKAKLEEREEDSRGNGKVRYRRALSHDDSESEVSVPPLRLLATSSRRRPRHLNEIPFAASARIRNGALFGPTDPGAYPSLNGEFSCRSS